LEAWFEEFNEDPIQDEWFAQPLPEKCIIVEMDEHRGSFNRKYYTPRYIYVEGDSLGSYTIGYRTINDYSALWGHVVFDTIDEYIEKYCDDSDAMDLLKKTFNLENAKEYGLSEEYYDIWEEQPEEETED